MSVAPSCSVLFKAFYVFINVAVSFVLGYFWATNDERKFGRLWATFRKWLAPHVQKTLATLVALQHLCWCWYCMQFVKNWQNVLHNVEITQCNFQISDPKHDLTLPQGC